MVQSIPQDLIDKLDRYAVAQRDLSKRNRRAAVFADEIREALLRFYAEGGISESAQPGGHSDDRSQR